MTGLQLFWTGLLGLSVFLFFAVELTVVIGGAYNIASMLRALREHGRELPETGGTAAEAESGGSRTDRSDSV